MPVQIQNPKPNLHAKKHLNVVVEVPGGALGDEQQRLELHITLGLEVDAVQRIIVVLQGLGFDTAGFRR